MIDEIKVIDDYIPNKYQEAIENLFLGNDFPWYYIKDITRLAEDSQSRAAFVHQLVKYGNVNSSFFNFIHPLIYPGIDKITELDSEFNVHQCRSFLQLPLNKKYTKGADNLHIDMTDPHIVILYYVKDSDGDTIIVDKKIEGNLIENDLDYKDYNILERITPKRGRAVIFNGAYYHTAYQPTENSRCVINFNIT